MSVRHFVLLAFLFTNSAALAAGAPEIMAAEAVAVSPAKMQLSEKIQALLETITTPDMALQESRKYQQNGQYGLAKIVLQHGIELAQSSGRFGSKVTVLEAFTALPKDDPEIVDRLKKTITKEGLVLKENVVIKEIKKSGKNCEIHFKHDNKDHGKTVSLILFG